MVGRWESILVCLAAALLLVVLVDGWAIGFLPRVLEKLVILAAFLVLVALAVVALMGRDGRVFYSRDDARRLDE
ncbi:MAG: hypothetical protein ACXWF3_12515 [Solirubrobacterales bacterium]